MSRAKRSAEITQHSGPFLTSLPPRVHTPKSNLLPCPSCSVTPVASENKGTSQRLFPIGHLAYHECPVSKAGASGTSNTHRGEAAMVRNSPDSRWHLMVIHPWPHSFLPRPSKTLALVPWTLLSKALTALDTKV